MSGITVSFNQESNKSDSSSSLIWRFLLAALFSAVAVAVCATGWGILAYLTGKIYIIVAILIGMVITFAITYPFNRISLPLAIILFFPAAFLTIVTVLLGDYLFYVLTGIFEYKLGLADAVFSIASQPIEFLQESVGSVLLAAIGTLLGFVNAIRRQ